MWRFLRNRRLILRLHVIFRALIAYIGRIARSSLRARGFLLLYLIFIHHVVILPTVGYRCAFVTH